ncbi:MAG: ABC transporter permease [Deltaproteobacteria bacterium]|nr:ABC transporter permease [Deltaproteobacteria bacterium]
MGDRRAARPGFGLLFGGALALAAIWLVFIGLANALFLGWSDWIHFLCQGRTWRCFGLSVGTAGLATCVSMLLAVPLGFALSRARFRGQWLLQALLDLPIMVPPAAVGMFLLGLFGSGPGAWLESSLGIQLVHALPGVVLAQVVVTCAFGVRVCRAAFEAIPPTYEAVARSLGASLASTFFRVHLPLARSALLAATCLVWARALAEYEALMLFVGAIQGRTDVMPLAVYLDTTAGKLEWATVFSFLCAGLGVVSLWAIRRLGARRGQA